MQPMNEDDARKLIHAGEREGGDCCCEQWARTDTGVWIGTRVATDVELRWYGADSFVAIERIAWEFYSEFPRYLGNYDAERDGLTCDAWWLKRVERARDAGSAAEGSDGEREFYALARAATIADGPLVDVTPDPLLQRVTNEPL